MPVLLNLLFFIYSEKNNYWAKKINTCNDGSRSKYKNSNE